MPKIDQNDVEIRLWEQERGFWMPRITALIAVNSLLFIGYAQLRDLWVGIPISVIAFVANLMTEIQFSQLEGKLNKYEERINWLIPYEFRKSNKNARGRHEYLYIIALFCIVWIFAAMYSCTSSTACKPFFEILNHMK